MFDFFLVYCPPYGFFIVKRQQDLGNAHKEKYLTGDSIRSLASYYSGNHHMVQADVVMGK